MTVAGAALPQNPAASSADLSPPRARYPSPRTRAARRAAAARPRISRAAAPVTPAPALPADAHSAAPRRPAGGGASQEKARVGGVRGAARTGVVLRKLPEEQAVADGERLDGQLLHHDHQLLLLRVAAREEELRPARTSDQRPAPGPPCACARSAPAG